jgi:ubiquinone/menaquinone biosynthesis C-methylase UbiE
MISFSIRFHELMLGSDQSAFISRYGSSKEIAVAEQEIRFDDGAAYEQMMGIWSRTAGDVFLDWLAPRSGLSWIDVGCGNGAFTELIVARCAPAEVHGIDPSEGQLAFARTRLAADVAQFHRGDAMALPFPNDSFDAAVMALVIFFVPDPTKGVAEMTRTVRPGGLVSAYAWDIPGGGLPNSPIQAEMRAMGIKPLLPPNANAARIDALRNLWTRAGLEAVQTHEITVQRTFDSFDDFWTSSLLGGGIGPVIAAMPSGDVELLKARVRSRLPADVAGRVTANAHANAIKGQMPMR